MEVNPSTSLQDFYDSHYLPGNLKIRSKSTKNHYQILLRQFREFVGREPVLGDLTDANCTGFARWLEEVKGVSAFTINSKLDYLKAIWRWCARERYVEKFPNFYNVPEPTPVPRAWTIEQIGTLLEACRETPGWIQPYQIAASEWWTNLHLFAWETGERAGAIFEVRWEDIDPGRCLVEVPAKYRKGKKRGMIYFISQELMNRLVEMRRDDPRVFPWPYCIGSFYYRYKAILKRAGLPHDRRSKLHKMRRSFASHLEAAGGNATEALKHSSRKITDESYLDESIVQRTPSYKLLPEIGGKDEVA